MRGRSPGRGPALLVTVVLSALAFVVLAPGSGAQPATTEPPSSTSTTVGSTTTAAPAPTTTVAPTTTRAPTTTVVEEEPEVVVTTTRRITTTTLRPTTTTARASTTTTSSTTTTVVAAVVPTTSRPVTITSSTLQPDTSSGNETRSRIDRIVRLLFGIAGLTTVLGLGYAWYTSPRRRVRVAERRAALASQRLDDAVAASFVGTTLALDRNAADDDLTAPVVLDAAGNEVDDADDATAREGLASKLFPRREDDLDDPDRPNPRPDPRPRPNDAPWEQ